MKFEFDCCRPLVRLLQAMTLIALMSCAPSASAPYPANAKPSGKLSARLTTLATSGLRAASAEEQARALSLPPSGPGSLMRDAQGRLLVTIRMTDLAPAQLQTLRDAGAVITNIAQPYRTVTAFVALGDLTKIAGIATVESVMEELTPARGGGIVAPPTP